MGISEDVRNLRGVVTVQIEGFFTERFINLCRINNIKIWEIKNIVKGIVRFKINISDFKKLRMVARKTKCKVKIKQKKGLYFTFFKYRKRKAIIMLVSLVIVFSIAFSTFIWHIEIEGNTRVSSNQIIEKLDLLGFRIGKCRLGLDKKEIVNSLRVEVPDLAWVGIDINGTTATVKVVEKVKLADENVQQTNPGDIVATKSGIITRIVPENGTAKYNEGSYIEEGTVAIEGMIYSKFLEPVPVPAKGILKINCQYEYQKDYYYEEIEKEYTGKKRYTIGFSVDSKENMLNYLNKNKKYDITKNSKSFSMFGKIFSFDIYHCLEYQENCIVKSKEEIEEQIKLEANTYLEEQILSKANQGELVELNTKIQEIEGGFRAITTYVINEKIGTFVERN